MRLRGVAHTRVLPSVSFAGGSPHRGAQTESDYPEALEIQRIYVLQKYQGKRIGLAMMQQALAVAEELKKPQVWLGVWENNFKAQAFYQKSGFKKVGSHDFILGNDKQTDYILLKTL